MEVTLCISVCATGRVCSVATLHQSTRRYEVAKCDLLSEITAQVSTSFCEHFLALLPGMITRHRRACTYDAAVFYVHPSGLESPLLVGRCWKVGWWKRNGLESGCRTIGYIPVQGKSEKQLCCGEFGRGPLC